MTKNQTQPLHPFLLAVTLICWSVSCWGQQNQHAIELTLPAEIETVIDIPNRIYFDNIILTQSPDKYQFDVSCSIGVVEDRCWSVTPTQADVGEHKLEIKVYDSSDAFVDSASSIVTVCDDRALSSDETLRLLIIGDSLTHATAYPNEIARLLSRPERPAWQMLGTHRPSSASEGVMHEGYGGWTWQRFVSHYEPDPDPKQRKWSSPFVFLDETGKPSLNMQRYFDESCDGARPDYVIIMLGINDCFSATADDPAAIDARVDSMFVHADRLLAAIRDAAPNAIIGCCLTTPPNVRQEAFTANYADRYTRWGWKRIQHQLVQRQIRYLTAKSDPQIQIIPTQLNLDPIEGYPDNNAVHPNAFGYRQIGTTIYAWLANQLAEMPTTQK